MYYYDTPEFYKYLPQLTFIFLITGSIIWLGWEFQRILRVLISKIKGDLIKLTVDRQDLKQIAKVREIMDGEKTEESKPKKDPIIRIPATMLFMAFFMVGIALLIIINEMFDSVENLHMIAVIVFTALMVLCAFLLYCILYLEREDLREDKRQTRIREIIDRGNDSRYLELLAEIRIINGHSEKVDRFLKAQYGKLYDLVE